MYGTATTIQVMILLTLAVCSCVSHPACPILSFPFIIHLHLGCPIQVFNWTAFAVYCDALMLFGVGHLFLLMVLTSRFTNKITFLLFYTVYVLADVVFLCISFSRSLDAPWRDCPSEAVVIGLFIPSLLFNVSNPRFEFAHHSPPPDPLPLPRVPAAPGDNAVALYSETVEGENY